jgi:predicted deacetylase
MIHRSDDITVDCDVVKLRELDEIFGKEILAVVYKGRIDGKGLTFNENDELMRFLKEKIKRGSEIALHGYYHRDITQKPTGEAIWELIQAKKEIESLLEVKIRYYVPFQHKITQEIIDYLKVIDIEVLLDDGQDLAQLMRDNQLPNPESKQLWYHWWELNVNKLKTYLERMK